MYFYLLLRILLQKIRRLFVFVFGNFGHQNGVIFLLIIFLLFFFLFYKINFYCCLCLRLILGCLNFLRCHFLLILRHQVYVIFVLLLRCLCRLKDLVYIFFLLVLFLIFLVLYCLFLSFRFLYNHDHFH